MTANQEQLERIATQLMAALIIENRIAWTQDPECFGVYFEEIANEAITGAKFLIKALEKEEPKGAKEQRPLRDPYSRPEPFPGCYDQANLPDCGEN